jgi:hypothetical protein
MSKRIRTVKNIEDETKIKISAANLYLWLMLSACTGCAFGSFFTLVLLGFVK